MGLGHPLQRTLSGRRGELGAAHRDPQTVASHRIDEPAPRRPPSSSPGTPAPSLDGQRTEHADLVTRRARRKRSRSTGSP